MTEVPDQLSVHVCGAKCDAGGPEHQGGHKFTVEYETEDGLEGGFACEKCGMTNVSFSMWVGE